MTGTFPSRVARCAAVVVLAAVGAFGLGASPAQAADGVAQYSVEASIDAEGTLAVQATLGLALVLALIWGAGLLAGLLPAIQAYRYSLLDGMTLRV